MLCPRIYLLSKGIWKVNHQVIRNYSYFSSSRPLFKYQRNVCLKEGNAYTISNKYKLVSKVSEFHTSKSCKAIPPILVAIIRPLANVVAVLVGRGIRKWWNSLTPSKRKRIFDNLKENRFKFLGGATVFSFAGYCYYELHVTEAPITKRKRFILFSKNELLHLAELQRTLLLEDYGKQLVPSDHYLFKRVASVKDRLIQKNGDIPGVQDGQWTLNLIHDPHQRNAFVLPNKSIFVFTGMLEVCRNDDQLAMILAHEISHVLLSHMEENLSKTHVIQMMLLIPVLLFWAVLPNEGALLSHWLTSKATHLMIDLPFSRNIEKEADEVGLQMIAKACYDVREASKLWEKMDELSGKDKEQSIEWLSTHPSFLNRKTYVDEQIPSAIRLREDCKCPPLTDWKI